MKYAKNIPFKILITFLHDRCYRRENQHRHWRQRIQNHPMIINDRL